MTYPTTGWCICGLEPGHGPTPHECENCGQKWGICLASPDCIGREPVGYVPEEK